MSFEITQLIKEQSFECLIMFCGGIALMIVYQLCSFLSHQVKLKRWLRIGLELCFWVAASVMTCEFLYYSSHGKLSLHCVIAFIAGLLLWRKTFYGIIRPNTFKPRRTRGLRNEYGQEKKESRI